MQSNGQKDREPFLAPKQHIPMLISAESPYESSFTQPQGLQISCPW